MVGARVLLGDSHNFGRRVALQDERVVKPRTVFWEWLVLSRESPLRRLLSELAAAEGLGAEAFEFLPALEFFERGQHGGHVERLQLEPLGVMTDESRRELSVIVGRSLSLWSWLGVADLHWENLALGVDASGRMIFGPLDVEMMLADLGLPTETKLLPDADPEYAEVCRHAAGVRRVLPYLGKPVAAELLLPLLAAYRATLEFLERHAAALSQVVAELPEHRTAPLRVLLRGTGDYAHVGRKDFWPPLLEAEAEQLARGDIPYFFRIYGQKGIHYFASSTLEQVERLPLKGDVPQLDPLLELSRSLKSTSRRKLRDDGLFTVLGAFDHKALRGTHESDGLRVTFSKRNLTVTLSSGEELGAERDLSAFVGSVYLPCRCGEARSVLVPSVTVCESAGSSV